MKTFNEWLTESVLIHIDSIAQQIKDNALPLQNIKQTLGQITQLLGQDGHESEPHYIHMASVVLDDIVPALANNPAFHNDLAMLQALAQEYV